MRKRLGRGCWRKGRGQTGALRGELWDRAANRRAAGPKVPARAQHKRSHAGSTLRRRLHIALHASPHTRTHAAPPAARAAHTPCPLTGELQEPVFVRVKHSVQQLHLILGHGLAPHRLQVGTTSRGACRGWQAMCSRQLLPNHPRQHALPCSEQAVAPRPTC